MAAPMDGCQIYLVSPPAIAHPARFAEQLDEACAAGRVGAFQLRLKEADDEQIIQMAELILPVLLTHDVAFIINDSPHLLAECGAGGVHLGEDDMPIAQARASLSEGLVLGASCYDSFDMAIDAANAGADYVAFGSFYASPTKANTRRPSPLLLAKWASLSQVPCVAIGGITADNAAPLVEHGADFIAVSSYVWSHGDGASHAVRALGAVIDATPARAYDLWLNGDEETAA